MAGEYIYYRINILTLPKVYDLQIVCATPIKNKKSSILNKTPDSVAITQINDLKLPLEAEVLFLGFQPTVKESENIKN
jgi:hypothetical protein